MSLVNLENVQLQANTAQQATVEEVKMTNQSS